MSDGRVVVVTGGSRGIGRAIALSLAEGARAVLINHYDPDEEAASETVARLEAAGVEAEQVKLDVADHDAVKAYFGQRIERYGGVDVLVNNAGITADTLLVRMTEDVWDRVLAVNLKGTFNCCQAVVRAMMQARRGSIINVASVVALVGNAGQSNYAASKAGILALTKSLAKEVGARGVRVNAVAPGYIETDMTAHLSDKIKEGFLSQIALGRAGAPEDVANVVSWLASEAASYLTGQVIHVSGGMFM
jgi:3-oxoacyl-[acyl-carrier protein] reductase